MVQNFIKIFKKKGLMRNFLMILINFTAKNS